MTRPVLDVFDELAPPAERSSRAVPALVQAQEVLDPVTRPPLPLEWADDITFDPLGLEEIVEDVFGARRMSVTYGDSNAGKTTLMLDLAFRMPTGRTWLGKRVEPGAVIYVAAESPHSVRLRLEAFRRHHGGQVGAFGMIPLPLNLLEPSADVDDLIGLILREQDRLQRPVRWLAIDTLARVIAGANENAGEDMSRLVAASDRLRHETAAHVNWVHHTGKNTAMGARGHSSLRAACDTELEVTADETQNHVHAIEITKQRDLWSKGESLRARFVPIELGRNQWGKPITACAVEHVEPASPHIAAVMQRNEQEACDRALLAGFERLLAQGIQPTNGETSPDFLPKRLLEHGLAEGHERKDLAAAMRRLMNAGVLKRGQVGTYGNRSTPRFGLVLVE